MAYTKYRAALAAAAAAATLASLIAVLHTPAALALPLPHVPPPPLPPLPFLVDPCKASSPLFDLAKLGATKLMLGGPMMVALQAKLKGVFALSMFLEGVAKFKFDLLLVKVAAAISEVLVSFQFHPGTQAFLQLFGMEEQKEALLVKAVCTLYPWDTAMPAIAQAFKITYCTKALPAIFANAISPIGK